MVKRARSIGAGLVRAADASLFRGRSRRAGAALVVGAVLAACDRTPPPPPPPPPGPTLVGQAPVPPGTPIPSVPPVPPVAPPPTAGAITLATGFQPDPTTATGTAGGTVDATTMNPACRGYVQPQPNHTLLASSAFASLRVLVNGGNEDTTLVVQKPDGTFVCDDDTEGRNPVVQFATTPGMHRIWVGSYQPGTTPAYVVGFSEIASVTTAAIGGPPGAPATGPSAGALDTSGSRSNFGTVTLRPGFQPDPHVTEGTSGAAEGSDIDASQVDARCRGHVTTTPDHIFVASAAFGSLAIAARSDGDTTLVVRAPDGTFLCDDDGGGGRNPLVRGSFPPGTYSIWVGSYSGGSNFGYRLGFSELPGFNAEKL